MKPRALDRKALRDLWHLKGQLFAISLVIACGIATFVSMLSTLDSLDRAMRDFYAEQRFADLFVSLKRAPESEAAKIADIPGVAAIESRIVADLILDVPGTVEVVNGRMISLPDRGRERLNELFLRRGRLPRLGSDDEVVVSEAFAEAHRLEPADTLAVVLNQRRQRLRVVGIALSPEYVYSIRPGGLIPDDRLFGVLWMRREALARAFDMDGAFNDLSSRTARGADEDEIARLIDDRLARWGSTGVVMRADQPSNWYLQNELTELRGTGLVLPFVFLGVAAFLLNVVMSRLVGQQREQIAVLEAFGYGKAEIGLHYAKFVLVVVVLATILGALGGAWMGQAMCRLYTAYFRFPELAYEFDFRYLVQAVLVAAVAALFGTSVAVFRALRIPCAEAMRPAAPESFRISLLERLLRRRFLGTVPRMILRNLGRRPLRASLSVLGIACGVALLVAGYALVDSVNHTIDLQFAFAQREDAQLGLVEPRSISALDDIVRLPGVRRAEPIRSVAVRLRSGHRSRRLALLGISADADLYRLLDRDARPLALPGEGLALSRQLAEQLEVGVGDGLRVEVLQERRGVFVVEVARVVESFIGTTAAMEISALNRRLGEGPAITGAHLALDGSLVPQLHRRLKEAPAVAGVVLQAEMMRSFEETAAESLLVMSLFLVGFSVVIAAGVVYSDARVILSERARDLASMRVLGYRRGEIRLILLGELWLLTSLAIPLGFLLGYGLSVLTLVGLETELFRIELAILPSTYGVAALVVVAAALVSGLLVSRRLDRLDLVEVLKTRE